MIDLIVSRFTTLFIQLWRFITSIRLVFFFTEHEITRTTYIGVKTSRRINVDVERQRREGKSKRNRQCFRVSTAYTRFLVTIGTRRRRANAKDFLYIITRRSSDRLSLFQQTRTPYSRLRLRYIYIQGEFCITGQRSFVKRNLLFRYFFCCRQHFHYLIVKRLRIVFKIIS